MPKKVYNKTAIVSYLSILIAVASFGMQYAYEGWNAKGVIPMLSPIGIGSILIFVIAIGLFIWNLRREELTHGQWLEIIKIREEPLTNLENALEEYKNYTNELSTTDTLYDLNLYGFRGTSTVELYSIVAYNRHYAALKNSDTKLSKLLSDIEMLISKLSNKKLRKLMHSLYRREDIAHSFSIFNVLYKTHYKPHPRIEKRIYQTESIPKFEQAFARIYEWIKIMRRGADLD